MTCCSRVVILALGCSVSSGPAEGRLVPDPLAQHLAEALFETADLRGKAATRTKSGMSPCPVPDYLSPVQEP